MYRLHLSLLCFLFGLTSSYSPVAPTGPGGPGFPIMLPKESRTGPGGPGGPGCPGCPVGPENSEAILYKTSSFHKRPKLATFCSSIKLEFSFLHFKFAEFIGIANF